MASSLYRSLENKVVLLTGSTLNAGPTIARKFAGRGARLWLHGLPGDPVVELARELSEKSKAEVYIGDVAVESQAEECVIECLKTFGRIDILINNTDLELEPRLLEHERVSDFDRLIFASIRSTFLMTRFALPYLKRTRGAVISAGAELGRVNRENAHPIHSATRAWVEAFTLSLSEEVRKDGVRANCVASPVFDWRTDLFGPEPEILRRHEEVAKLYCFLASEEAQFITGAIFADEASAQNDTASFKAGPEPTHQNAGEELGP